MVEWKKIGNNTSTMRHRHFKGSMPTPRNIHLNNCARKHHHERLGLQMRVEHPFHVDKAQKKRHMEEGKSTLPLSQAASVEKNTFPVWEGEWRECSTSVWIQEPVHPSARPAPMAPSSLCTPISAQWHQQSQETPANLGFWPTKGLADYHGTKHWVGFCEPRLLEYPSTTSFHNLGKLLWSHVSKHPPWTQASGGHLWTQALAPEWLSWGQNPNLPK